jgi:hypothetical protein
MDNELSVDAQAILVTIISIVVAFAAFPIYIYAVEQITPKADPGFTMFTAFLMLFILGVFIPLMRVKNIFNDEPLKSLSQIAEEVYDKEVYIIMKKQNCSYEDAQKKLHKIIEENF